MTAISVRINTLLLVVIILMAGAIITMLATRAYGGPLDPTGPPAATDGVREPGTPISSIPFLISQPGRYYLTRNLTGPGNSNYGINIQASNVTLDLNGFTMDGGDSTGMGVIASAGYNVSVENGTVTHYATGIDLFSVNVGSVSRVKVLNLSTTVGVGVRTPYLGLLSDCVISSVYRGVTLGQQSIMRGCTVSTTYENGVVASGLATIADSTFSIAVPQGPYYEIVAAGAATIRNNTFGYDLRNVHVTAGIATIIDNIVYCPEAVTQASPNLMIAPMGSEPHANVPRVAAGFCS